MKKNLVRIVALLLVAMLALTLLPLGALAATVTVTGGTSIFDEPRLKDMFGFWYIETESECGPVTIKTSNYDSYIVAPNGFDYDLQGVVHVDKAMHHPWMPLDPQSSVTLKHDGTVMLIYTPHQHKLSRWYSDGTTHWRECLVCSGDFFYQNWCQDGDEDGVCNVCGGEVPYHDVTIINGEGGKITVNEETASHRTKIIANVEPAEGYKLKKLHFIKVREDGTKQEITRRKNSDGYWTLMPTYDLEVSAEFVKK